MLLTANYKDCTCNANAETTQGEYYSACKLFVAARKRSRKAATTSGESKALEERMVTALETYVDLLARSELGGEEGKRMEMEKIRMLNECGDCR